MVLLLLLLLWVYNGLNLFSGNCLHLLVCEILLLYLLKVFLKLQDVMSDIYEDTALQEWLPSVILETQNSDIAAEAALGILDGVYEVPVSSEQRYALYVATQSVVDQVHSDGNVDLSLHLPLDLLLAPAPALSALLLVLPDVEEDLPLVCYFPLHDLVELAILRPRLVVLRGHKAHLVELVPRYTLK